MKNTVRDGVLGARVGARVGVGFKLWLPVAAAFVAFTSCGASKPQPVAGEPTPLTRSEKLEMIDLIGKADDLLDAGRKMITDTNAEITKRKSALQEVHGAKSCDLNKEYRWVSCKDAGSAGIKAPTALTEDERLGL